MRIIKKHGNKLLYKELRKSYNFFIKEANTNKKSKGYGLIRDKTILSDSVMNLEIENDWTISPCGAIGSIVFTPKESIKAIEYYYNTFKKLWGKYGFKDGFNLEGKEEWFAKEYIGIDKGIELLMIENYLNETIWKYFMRNEYVIKGLNILGFTNTNIPLLSKK